MPAENPSMAKGMKLYGQEKILLTVSATRKPRLVGGDKDCNKKQTVSLPGSPALWAGSFKSSDRKGFFLRGLL
jgi:hypothetical protein